MPRVAWPLAAARLLPLAEETRVALVNGLRDGAVARAAREVVDGLVEQRLVVAQHADLEDGRHVAQVPLGRCCVAILSINRKHMLSLTTKFVVNKFRRVRALRRADSGYEGLGQSRKDALAKKIIKSSCFN